MKNLIRSAGVALALLAGVAHAQSTTDLLSGLAGRLAASVTTKALTLNGQGTITDSGRAGNDNSPTFGFTVSEALNYTSSYATHYGLIMSTHETSGGTGDRIGIGAVQTCDATLTGKSCVGGSSLAVAGGTAVGNYTGHNPKCLLPAGLTGPAGECAGAELDVETHSPVKIKNGLRIADENLAGTATTHGSIEDAAIAIVNDSGNTAQGFNIGIQFGENPQGYPNNWPILANGTLIQASNPNVGLLWGIDLTGSTAGFGKYAIGLPQNISGNGITWGTAGTAGNIASTATTNGGAIAFTNAGISLNNPSGGPVLNVGGSTGSDVVNSGYMTEASLTGFVYCNGSGGRCTATTTLTHAQQEVDKSYVYTSPTNGATLTFGATTETVLIDPAGALSSLTVTLQGCNSGNDALIARFSTTQALSGMTVNAAAGVVANAPNAMSAGQGHAYLCDGARAAWYPLY
ncbi:autotransporter outer membrane beta-barrel domain-containing protein [Burkholderia cepacia]|uniref:hypothetical protein n=1 Tax=Burkholderia cepacia TaxID=292 RepID=UPI001CF4F197|nr:hypothetical protein [Burkholderia cepacia]MCA8115673.1 hypothetical protein [Burkholderia cepacia]MCA8402760.1 hypothetical protein [Burkholderia cepacia]